MSVTPKPLINSQYAPDSITTGYTVPVGLTASIDKFSATNSDSGAQTITVYLVPSGGSAGASNMITKALSIAAGAAVELTELKNHILAAGDSIAVVASAASKIIMRASGREWT